MLILNNELAYIYHPIIRYIPKRLRKHLICARLDNVEEIRLRKGRPIMLYGGFSPKYITEKGISEKSSYGMIAVNDEDINEALELICESSLYAVEDRIKNG